MQYVCTKCDYHLYWVKELRDEYVCPECSNIDRFNVNNVDLKQINEMLDLVDSYITKNRKDKFNNTIIFLYKSRIHGNGTTVNKIIRFININYKSILSSLDEIILTYGLK